MKEGKLVNITKEAKPNVFTTQNCAHSKYQSWSYGIQQQIHADFHNDQIQYYWILNAAAHPDMPSCIWKLEKQPNAWPLFMNTYSDGARNSGPWFLPCVPTSPLFSWIWEHSETLPLGILIKAQAGSESMLFEHFQQLLECFYPSGEDASLKNGIFRFYDPRILYGISTWQNGKYAHTVCGSSLSIHAWEPGRSAPVTLERKTDEYTICKERHLLTQDFFEHLWAESQPHTIITTLSGDAGDKLRNMPLPEACELIQSMHNMLSSSQYTTNADISFATALSLLTQDDTWEDVVESVVLQKLPSYPSLEEALIAAIPIWEAENHRVANFAR